MERDLLARFTGDTGGQRLQGQRPLPPPSPALSLRMGSEEEPQNRADHSRPPQRGQAAADVVAWPCPPAPRVSVVVPGGHPTPLQQRPAYLPAVAGAWSHTGGGGGQTRSHGSLPDVLPTRPSMAGVPILQPIGATALTRQEQCRRDACGLCAQLMQGLAADLDRAQAQVALLTCENESLRHRLKRAAAGVVAETGPAAALPARLHVAGGLRCRACRDRPATVLLSPREHLCLCGPCSDACRYDPAIACWVCRDAVRTGSRHPAVAPR